MKLEEIDYGYCIPDCGICCLGVVHITEEEAIKIAKERGIEPSKFYDSENRQIKMKDGKCSFLSDYSLCRIYSFRPEACRNFPERPIRCLDYWIIFTLELLGRGIKARLREMFLERRNNQYDRLDWFKRAKKCVSLESETHLIDLIEFLRKKIS